MLSLPPVEGNRVIVGGGKRGNFGDSRGIERNGQVVCPVKHWVYVSGDLFALIRWDCLLDCLSSLSST